jgi:MSHA biogenesis protein MshP
MNDCLDSTCFRPRQRGFAIVAAIFLLVILSALGAFMLTFSTVQHTTNAQDIQGSRAYWAAQAGLEWGTYKVFADAANGPPVAPSTATWPNMPGCAAATATLAIEGFNVAVTCTCYPSGAAACAPNSSVYTEAGDTRSIAIYKLTATATAGTPGSLSYIERQVTKVAGSCRAVDASAPSYDCP